MDTDGRFLVMKFFSPAGARRVGKQEAGASGIAAFPGRSLGEPGNERKLDCGRCVDPKGSAGILPALAGILPASWCRRAGDGVGSHSARAQASGRMPKAAGWKPALPFG